jgi:hypothetical protein
MKQLMKAAMIFVIVFICSNANAQKGWRMGISAIPGVATNGGYGLVLGTDIRLQTNVADKTFFTLTTGITGFFKKDNVKGMSYIPVKPGLKYMLTDNLYTGGELGVGFGLVKNSGRSFIWAPMLGLSFKTVDISVKYEDASDFKFPDGSNNNYCKQFALRVAYGFSLQ